MADVCAWVDLETANKAAVEIRRAGAVLSQDWTRDIAVHSLEIKRRMHDAELVLNGEITLDLAYTYVPHGDQAYRNIGYGFDCLGHETPRTISRSAFVPPSDATRFNTIPWRPDPGRPAPPAFMGLIGLLELPELDAANGGEIKVRRAPDAAAAIVAYITSWQDIASAEYDYETPGAIVTERVAGWYRVALSGEARGWLAAADAGAFHGYPALIAETLTYLTVEWSGELFAKPGDPAPNQNITAAWRRKMRDTPSVDITGIARIDESLWFKVAVRWPEPCAGEPTRTIGEGWVPAYGDGRRPSVWFYSRGC